MKPRERKSTVIQKDRKGQDTVIDRVNETVQEGAGKNEFQMSNRSHGYGKHCSQTSKLSTPRKFNIE